jgi:nucleoside-diphosphate-sugar epimerase
VINIKILVTGGAGYIGSNLTPELLKTYKVRVLDNLTYGYYGIIPHINNPDFEFIYGDIRSSNILKKSLKDIDLVIHLAAIVGYPACKAQPKLAKEINYEATKKLVELSKVPIIFTSTGSNYGHVTGICSEEIPLNPLTEYGKTKEKAERVIQSHSDFVIYRFSTGFGMSLRPRFDLLVNDFLFRAMKEKELIIYEKDYWRSFIHVKDMVDSLIFSIKKFNKMNGEVYNVGSEKLCLTKEDVALKIKEYVDYYLKFARFGEDPDKRNYKVNFNKIKSLGFKVKYDIDYGIKEMMKTFEFMDGKESYYNNRVFK